jgi:hypothetical protein
MNCNLLINCCVDGPNIHIATDESLQMQLPLCIQQNESTVECSGLCYRVGSRPCVQYIHEPHAAKPSDFKAAACIIKLGQRRKQRI